MHDNNVLIHIEINIFILTLASDLTKLVEVLQFPC